MKYMVLLLFAMTFTSYGCNSHDSSQSPSYAVNAKDDSSSGMLDPVNPKVVKDTKYLNSYLGDPRALKDIPDSNIYIYANPWCDGSGKKYEFGNSGKLKMYLKEEGDTSAVWHSVGETQLQIQWSVDRQSVYKSYVNGDKLILTPEDGDSLKFTLCYGILNAESYADDWKEWRQAEEASPKLGGIDVTVDHWENVSNFPEGQAYIEFKQDIEVATKDYFFSQYSGMPALGLSLFAGVPMLSERGDIGYQRNIGKDVNPNFYPGCQLEFSSLSGPFVDGNQPETVKIMKGTQLQISILRAHFRQTLPFVYSYELLNRGNHLGVVGIQLGLNSGDGGGFAGWVGAVQECFGSAAVLKVDTEAKTRTDYSNCSIHKINCLRQRDATY